MQTDLRVHTRTSSAWKEHFIVSSLQHGLYVPTAVRSGASQLLSILRLFQFTLELDCSKSSVCCSIDPAYYATIKYMCRIQNICSLQCIGHFHFQIALCSGHLYNIVINHMSLVRLKRWQLTFIGRGFNGHESVQTKNETITLDG